MSDADPKQVERLGDAFRAFEEALQEMLTQEARRSIDGTLERLSHGEGPFRVRGVEVEVVVRNISIEASSPVKGKGSAKAPANKRAPRAATRARRAESASATRRTSTGRQGRPPGAIRGALLAAFESGEEQLSTQDLRRHLRARKVTASDDNLHQHLRRLVQGGELERAGRGSYRRVIG